MTEPTGPVLRLLIDACLTPQAVQRLQEAFGPMVDAVHVDGTLPQGATDGAVLDLAAQEGRAVVTANTRDFVALVRERPSHHGLVLINDQNTRDRQVAAVTQVVGAILSGDDTHLAGKVMVWRPRTGQLAVRLLP